MNSLRNIVHLIGNLGNDVELIKLENGNHLAKLRIATDEFYLNKDGEKVKETQWHNLIAWGKKAEVMAQILKKGNEIAIQGKLTHRLYEKEEGNSQSFSEIVVSDFLKITSIDN